MRRIIVSMMVSVDGFIEGSNKEIDWHNVDSEFNIYAEEMLNHVDLIIFGRVTYQLMAKFWPSREALVHDPIIADKMNNLPKIVFSKTLSGTEWKNTRLAKEEIEKEITQLKKQAGKDMVILGSGSIVSQLTQLGLIDEYRIIVNPVILGSGKPLFSGLDRRYRLKLVKSKPYLNGNILLSYEPV